MPAQYKRVFDQLNDRNLFISLEDGDPSLFEIQLRFSYAVNNVLRYVRNRYTRFETRFDVVQNPPMRIDYDIWYPKQGNPAILSTELSSGPVPRALARNFQEDPIYREFEPASRNPPEYLAIIYESNGNGQDEFSKLVKIFENGCSDINWKLQLPRFLRQSR